MLKHEYFEELCAAASVGQANGEELVELEKHVAECYSCRQAYSDYLSIAAQEFVVAAKQPRLSDREAQECLNSELFIQRFFERAQREGIVFSQQVAKEGPGAPIIPFSFSRPAWRNGQFGVMAAAAAMLMVCASVWVHKSGSFNSLRSSLGTEKITSSARKDVPAPDAEQIADLTSANHGLESEIAQIKAELAAANEQLAANAANQKTAITDRQRFISERNALAEQLSQVQYQLAEWQSLASGARHDAEAQHKHAGDLEVSLVAAEAELTEITEKLTEQSAALNRDRQLLAMGKDVSDLMGARNLHILDVVDTDARGKTRPAFGRIFFTEGKSLVFYAYDLNESKIQKANYQYQVWAKKEGQNRPVRRLGIFYADDKTQNRWVFKCDDPNVVREIDSVFVTLGRPNSDPAHPEGSRLMFAYLHGPPNHP